MKKPKCPTCGKVKDVVLERTPVVMIDGSTAKVRSFLCQWCCLIFLVEAGGREAGTVPVHVIWGGR
jgi:transposase-like protein